MALFFKIEASFWAKIKGIGSSNDSYHRSKTPQDDPLATRAPRVNEGAEEGIVLPSPPPTTC